MKCYKLLDRNMESRNGGRWTIGEWKEADELGFFCGPGGFHGYVHPLLAVLHNQLHANIRDPRLFEAEAAGRTIYDGQMQLKAQRMRIVREIPIPTVSLEQRIAYGIYCAKAVYSDPQWNSWADAWMSGADRSQSAAKSAVKEAYRQCKAAALAADAAMRAALVADELCAADAAEKQTLVTWVAVKAAAAAKWAALTGRADLVSCAERAIGMVEAPGGTA